MKYQFIIMLALLAFSTFAFAALSGNSVDKFMTTSGTEYPLSAFTTTTQNGTSISLIANSSDNHDQGTLYINYVNATGIKKQASIALNGTSAISTSQNYLYTLSQGTTGQVVDINITPTSAGATGWNVSSSTANTNYQYNLSTIAGKQKINFTNVGQQNYTTSGWSLTKQGQPDCALNNVINVSADIITQNTSLTVNSSLGNWNNSRAQLFLDPTVRNFNSTAATFWNVTWYVDPTLGIVKMNDSGTWYPQGLKINGTNSTECGGSVLNNTVVGGTATLSALNYSVGGAGAGTGATYKICGPTNLGYFPNVYYVHTPSANWTWNKTALSTSNLATTDDGNILSVSGEAGIGTVNLTSGDNYSEVDWYDSLGVAHITTTNLSQCTNATLYNNATSSTFQTLHYTKSGNSSNNYSDIAYVYGIRLATNQLGNVSLTLPSGQLLYYLPPNTTIQPQAFYVCPESSGCTVKTLIVASDALTRFRVKIWNPNNSSQNVSSVFSAIGGTQYISANQQMHINMGQRMEIYGTPYLSGANATTVFEVN